MVCKITSTKRTGLQRRESGFLLAETMMAVLVVTVLMLSIVMFMVFSMRSFTTMYNYVELDDRNRIAMDQLTRDVRQCKRVIACDATRLVLEDDDGLPLSYTYHPAAGAEEGRLVRNKNGSDRVVLTGCDRLTFHIGQRNTVTGTYDYYPAASPATAKIVNVAWLCSRKVMGRKENTESVQTARIVIRKQGT